MVAVAVDTPERILDAALVEFGGRGYEATSLDALAASLGVRKQTILYWFRAKRRCSRRSSSGAPVSSPRPCRRPLRGRGEGFERIEAVVRSVFRPAARRPELLGLLRESAASDRRRRRG